MLPKVAGFDRDAGNEEKCRDHGVSVRDIEALFGGQIAVFPSPGRSRSEERYKAIGATQMDGTFFSSLHCGNSPARC
ncbi:hypothetical protein [Pseudorhodoplanes sp.]|uniref:hypothetical protein n=1 Tax=Pseudorhodoplanes sp. TaxID=1934341 RepID=UPI003D10176B